jgi:cytochrome oxidase assembly protein ShyY1
MYRFALRPRWIASHVLVLALVVVMINLGLWQLRRLDEKKARNANIVAQTAKPPATLAEIAAMTPSAAKFRVVTVAGRFDPSGEVAVKNRTFNGAPGRQVLTPLVPSAGGPAVLVLRGWIPLSVDDVSAPFEAIAPPSGEVTVTGWAMPPEPAPALSSAAGVLGDSEASRIDIDAIARYRGIALVGVYLQMSAEDPAAPASPLSLVPLPELDEGPHFSYAVQWAIFTLVALVGYPLILRRVARQPYHADDDGDADGP